MKNITLILISLMLLTGCFVPNFNPGRENHELYTESMFRSYGDNELCKSIHKVPYGRFKYIKNFPFIRGLKYDDSRGYQEVFSESYAKELREVRKENISVIKDLIKKRGLLNQRDLSGMRRSYSWEKYIIGMTQCGMYLVLGVPQTENKSVYSSGTHIQHIYEYKDLYVYTDNGIVTSYQLLK